MARKVNESLGGIQKNKMQMWGRRRASYISCICLLFFVVLLPASSARLFCSKKPKFILACLSIYLLLLVVLNRTGHNLVTLHPSGALEEGAPEGRRRHRCRAPFRHRVVALTAWTVVQ